MSHFANLIESLKAQKVVLIVVGICGSLQGRAQSSLVADIHPYSHSFPRYLTELNNKLYFTANGANGTGGELWVYDGSNPPSLAADIYPGPGSGMGGTYFKTVHFPVINERMYFEATNGSTGPELFSYDAITPPILVADIEPTANTGSNPNIAAYLVHNSKLYFVATTAATADELYVYDPSTSQAVVISNFPNNLVIPKSPMTLFGDKIFFRGNDGVLGDEPYYFDLTTNTYGMFDIEPGSGYSGAERFYVFGSRLYFTAETSTWGKELYEYTGTGSPVRLTDVQPGIADGIEGTELVWYNNRIFFGGFLGIATSTATLMGYDPTTGAVTDVCDTAFAIKHAGNFTQMGGVLYFTGEHLTTGPELMKYDGISPATLAADVRPGPDGSVLQELTVWNGVLYFSANTPATGFELFKYTSSTGVIKIDNVIDIEVFPVPSAAEVYLNINTSEALDIILTVTDIKGGVQYRTEGKHYSKGSSTITVPLQHCVSGDYFYRLSTNTGKLLSTGHLIRL